MKGDKIYLEAKFIGRELYNHKRRISKIDKAKLYKKYLLLLRRAAYIGHPEAQYDLAQQFEDMNYLYLNNPNYNPEKSFFWYEKATIKNHPAACNNLAFLYETGKGCNKNLRKALVLYKKSADLGDPIGKKNYKIMLRQMKVMKKRN